MAALIFATLGNMSDSNAAISVLDSNYNEKKNIFFDVLLLKSSLKILGIH